MMSPFNEFLLNASGISLMLLLVLLPVFLMNNVVMLMGQFVWLFGVLAVFNLAGLIPYSWTVTLYPVATFFTALLFWMTTSLTSLSSPTLTWQNRSLGHYLPLNTPVFLWGVLPLIEIVSQLIRPITLTVRLTANLVAGHVLIFLISQLGWQGCGLFLILIPFEMMVALVQGYVFVMLLDSYSMER